MSIRVLLVDDDEDVRASLRMIVDVEADLSVVGEAANATRAVALSRQLLPDVAVVDVNMPGRSGIQATVEIRALDTPPQVLILTSFGSDQNAISALAAGASGFLLKALKPGELPEAIRSVHAGRNVLAAPVLPAVIDRAVSAHRTASAAELPDELADLTAREVELLRAVGMGMPNSQIAAAMTISEASAKTYVSRLLEKLGLTNRTQLAIAAFRAGLLH